jgi:ElaB/YqjD/DUF883 family membrane-anchored ribosome-binding protein
MEPAVDFVSQTEAARHDAYTPADGVQELMRTRGEVRAALSALAAHGAAWVTQAAGLSPVAQRRLRGAQRQLADFGVRAGANVRDAAVVADRYVQARPWTAVGVAAGIGLVLGTILFRRK